MAEERGSRPRVLCDVTTVGGLNVAWLRGLRLQAGDEVVAGRDGFTGPAVVVRVEDRRAYLRQTGPRLPDVEDFDRG